MKTIAIALMLTQTAAAPVAAPLMPSGKWIVDYDDAACVLSHDFGTGAALTTIGFKPSPFGGNIEVVMITIGAKAQYRKGKAKLILQPSNITIDSDVDIYGIKTNDRTVTTLTVEGDVAAKLKSSTAITVAVVDGPRTSVMVHDMNNAFDALKTCQADLVKSWGIDPAELEKVAVPAMGAAPSEWITFDDYPGDAVSNHQQGTTVIVWSVSTAGRVADCKVVKSSGTASLDQASCRAITLRGRYKPAIGLDGKPMISHQMRKVVWHMPG